MQGILGQFAIIFYLPKKNFEVLLATCKLRRTFIFFIFVRFLCIVFGCTMFFYGKVGTKHLYNLLTMLKLF
jgi:hypothetical protein